MAVNIGPRIGIDGEAEYRKQMQNIIQQAKTLDAEMKKVTASFDKNTTAEEKARAVGEVLQKQIEVQKKRVEELQKGLEESTKKYGESDTATLKWKEALNAAEANLAKMEKGLDETGKATADYTKQADGAEKETDTFHDTLKALAANEGIKKGFEALSSAAKAVGEAVLEAGKAAAKAFKDSAEWADNIKTLASVSGISVEKLQELDYMSSLLDVDVETVAKAYAKLEKTMYSAAGGSKSSAEAFSDLGVEIKMTDGHLRLADAVFNDAVSALGEIANETERDAIAMQIFGKSAKDLNPLIEAGGKELSKLKEEAHNTGYVLDGEAVDALVHAQDEFDRLRLAGESLEHEFSAMLAPAIANTTENLLNFVQSNSDLKEDISDFIEQSGPVIMEIGLALIDVLRSAAPVLRSIAEDVLPPVLDLISQITPYVADFAQQLFPIIGDILATIMPFLSNIVAKILPPILKLLSAILPIVSSLLGIIVPILDCIIDIISPLISVVVDCLAPLLDVLAPINTALGDVLAPILKDLAPLFEIAFWPLKTIVIPLIETASAAIKKLVGWIQDAVNWMNKMFGKAQNKGLTVGSIAGSVSSAPVINNPLRSSAPLRSAPMMASLADSNDMITRGAGDLVDLVRPMMPFAMSGADTNPFFGGGSGRIPVPAGGQVLNNNNVTNYGGVTIEVNAAPGQDVNSIANAVMDKLQYAVRRREAVFQ